ncbi:MAG: HD domain-containing protein [Clostridiales bacterium]|nr:HD domain-containing protein [Clostridiales bacterium]
MKNLLSYEILTQRNRERTMDTRGPYFRDQTAIIHSTPFRRLKHKTQVFFAPENDHICTRIEHVLHVATIAASICKGLNSKGWSLSIELAYAAGLGHDLGHAPFGHSGERVLNKKVEGGFCHEAHSLRVVDHIARSGQGLNLTYGVRDAILCHNGEKFEQYLEPTFVYEDLENKTHHNKIPSTWEGCIVRFSDKIAYLGRDIEDALTLGVINRNDVPSEISDHLGESNGEIINTLVVDILENTQKTGNVGFSDERFQLIKKIRSFNYEMIYGSPSKLFYETDCLFKLNSLFDYLDAHYESIINGDIDKELNEAFYNYYHNMATFYDKTNGTKNQILVDYIAGMTDNYAVSIYEDLLR